MYISVGGKFGRSEIRLLEGIIDYGYVGYKKQNPQLQKIARFFRGISWEIGLFRDPQKGP